MEDAGILGEMMNALRIFIASIFLILSLPAASLALFLGPYSGAVIDSQTGEPIEGTSVLVYWEKRIPTPAGGYSELIEVTLVSTNRKGRYEVPRFLANLGLLGTLESTNIIIYQPGYQAYIMKIWHDSPYTKPDPSFKTKDNMVKLDRIPPGFNHGEHYRKISDALNGLHEYPYAYPHKNDPWMTWKKLLEINLKVIPEKEEFLRRAEWEERRGERE
jgi:hypothetical protein